MATKFVLKKAHSSAANSTIDEFVFDGDLLTIGSDAANRIVLAGSASEQAVVVREGELLTLINSHEGTILNNHPLRREAIEPLVGGDEIRVGNFIIAVVEDEPQNAENIIEPEKFSSGDENFSKNSAPVVTDSNEENLPFEDIGAAVSPTVAEKNPARNFADILNTLRTEEDSFYFIVRNGTSEEKSRLPLEQNEMPLGFDAQGELTCAAEKISVLCATVKKDWSGIVVEARRGSGISVNDETLETIRRLRNGDCLNLPSGRKNGKKSFSLELHEPSSLVALESILDTRPPSGKIKLNSLENAPANETEKAAGGREPVPFIERRFFGYFSFFEVAAMIIGTLMGAILIFILLEFIVG